MRTRRLLFFLGCVWLSVLPAVGLFWGSGQSATAGATLFGDANKDGHVDAIDAALVLQYSAGLLSSINPNADANGDGETNAIDAAVILQYVAGLVSHIGPSQTFTPTRTSTLTPTRTPMTTPAPATATPINTPQASSTTYRGGGLEGTVEFVVSADGTVMESFSITGLCRISPDDLGYGLFLPQQNIPIRLGSFSWSSGSNVVSGHISVDRTASGTVDYLSSSPMACHRKNLSWTAVAQ